MTIYNEDADDYSSGSDSVWNAPSQTSFYVGGPSSNNLGFAKFVGLTAVMGSTITEATLHIDNWGAPDGDVYLGVAGVTFEVPDLPTAWSTAWTAYQDYKTGDTTGPNGNGLNSFEIDVTTLIQTLQGLGYTDEILLMFYLASYSGAAGGAATCSLEITYDGIGGDDPPGTAGNPSAWWKFLM